VVGIDRAPDNSLLLIEEPETYLSPATQEALANFIISTTSEKFLNIIMTSHSPNILRNLPSESVICLYRERGKTRVAPAPVHPEWWKTVGIESKVDGIILVEDDMSELFLRHILERHDPTLSRRLEIQPKGGHGNITTVLKILDRQFRAIKFVGAFDGDMRGKIAEDISGFCIFLPGAEPIEGAFRKIVCNDHGPIEEAIGKEGIGAILAGLEGIDDHDWYERLAASVGKTNEQLFTLLYPIWEGTDNNEDTAMKVIDDITARMKEIMAL
jgi:AAA domain, putative AbiEii toxin, Type IV TA system